MFKDFASCFKYFLKTKKLKSTTSLSGIETLIKYLNIDFETLKIVHVAGTNGKGSTIAFIENVLVMSNYKTAKYISPAVIDERECICINGEKISENDFLRLFNKIYEVVELMLQKGMPHPTYFEIETALALMYFIENNVDIVLLECGLGGKYDCTNVIKNPLISILTDISLDHINVLGNSLKEITLNKCGIIKENSIVVTSNSGEVLSIIENEAKIKNAKLIKVNTDIDYEILDNKNVFEFGKNIFKTNLIGKYQITNACLAISAIEELQNFGFETSKNLVQGINTATNFGRLTLINEEPKIYVDGAHNEQASIALKQTIEKMFANVKINLLLSIFKDKEYKKIVKILSPLANKIVVTNVNSKRALNKKILRQEVLIYNKNVIQKKNPKKAIRYLINNTNKDEIIICAGTLSHISEIKAEVNKNG